MPAGFAGTDEVHHTPLSRKQTVQIGEVRQHDVGDGIGDRSSRRRRSDLIGDDAQLFALAGKVRDGTEEVGTLGGVHPGSARDQMRPASRLNGDVTGKLARAIDGERTCWAVLATRFVTGAIKNVVGGEVNEWHTMFGCPLRDNLGPFGVSEERELGLLLGTIDRGIGRRIHDKIGPEIHEPAR